jgi:hypothetical protein
VRVAALVGRGWLRLAATLSCLGKETTMDLKLYFDDYKKNVAKLEKEHPDGVVHVTSLFQRDRGSTPGSTASATCTNAARVITDGTHREATEEEIDAFYQRQQDELRKNIRAEQAKKQQYMVVMGEGNPLSNATIVPAQHGRTEKPAPLSPVKTSTEKTS